MRHPVRRKKGAVVVAVDARGGLVGGAPRTSRALAGARAPLDLRAAVERLATVIVARAIAKADAKAGRAPTKTPKAYRDQEMRLRRSMVASGPGGAELASAVTLALAGQGGRILRTAERAHLDARPYLERVGVYLAAFVMSGMHVPAALVRAGNSATSEALADMVLDHVVAQDPTVGIGATKSRVIDGARVTNTLSSFDGLMKMSIALRTLAGKEASLAAFFEGWGTDKEHEQLRRWEEQRWAMQRAARSEANEAFEAELVHEDGDSDVSGGGPDLLPSAEIGDHGPTREETPATASLVGDDSEEHDDAKASPGSTSREDGASPSAPADEEPTWCPVRKRLVPKPIAGTPEPSGPGYAERRQSERKEIDAWETRMRARAIASNTKRR